jgi:hypothetical protein
VRSDRTADVGIIIQVRPYDISLNIQGIKMRRECSNVILSITYSLEVLAVKITRRITWIKWAYMKCKRKVAFIDSKKSWI